ncbi:MAG: hypothetical protein GYA24_05550, partial [Candidatus Lokiarchaeota archaeon]|nr:hypothetical protein [Candidatus Lokiarchaeota archaeon]
MRRSFADQKGTALKFGIIITILAMVAANYAVSVAASMPSSFLWEYVLDDRGDNAYGRRILAAGDVDGDGFDEVIGYRAFFYMVCLESDGTMKWRVPAGTDPMLCDVDSNGAMDVIYTGSSYLKCLNGNNGSTRWSFTAQTVLTDAYAAGDVDDDGLPEIITITSAGDLVCLSGGTGTIEWEKQGPFLKKPPLIVDVARNSSAFIIAGYSNGTLVSIHGNDSDMYWNAFFGDIASPLMVHDINDDGFLDIIVNASSTLFIVSGYNGTILASYPILNNAMRSAVFSDFNDDGAIEMVGLFQVNKSHAALQCMSIFTGHVLWSQITEYSTSFTTYMLISDWNADLTPDIIISPGIAKIYSGNDGQLLESALTPMTYSGSTTTSY